MKLRIVAVFAVSGILGTTVAAHPALASGSVTPNPPPPPPVVLPDPVAIANQFISDVENGGTPCANVQYQVGPISNGDGDDICFIIPFN